MTPEECEKKISVLERRFYRERTARKSAEKYLEDKSLELYNLNQSLLQTNTEMKKLTTAVEQSSSSVMITDLNAQIEYINPMFTVINGWSFDEVKGKRPSLLKSELTPEETYQNLWETIQKGKVWKGELFNLRKSGEQYLQAISISPIYNENNEITHYLSSAEDITLKKKNEDQIYHLAHHDTLTGLLNRFSMEQRLEQAIAQSSRRDLSLAVLFLDLDRFKLINDTLGHKAGDELLIQVSQRLQAICQRQSDIVARIGGDEFVVVLSEINTPMFAALTARAIVEILSIPYVFNDEDIITTPSIGVSIFPDDGYISEDLLKYADMAMYHVKSTGRGNYEFYSEKMHEAVEEQIILAKSLSNAINNNVLKLHYQPKVCTNNKSVCSVEALLRWIDPELGFISPEKFIPIAEENDLMKDLGLFVINTAFKQLQKWQQSGLSDLSMAINVSPKQLESESFVDEVKELIKKYQLNHDYIEFEVTESAAMEDPEKSIERLKHLREIGITLAIDDFGTGYSSLSYLKHLPIQVLKLDKAFVMNLESDEDNAAISKATISLGHDLGYKIVAEGVETKEQKEFLEQRNCDILQGYYYSKPIPGDEIVEFIANFKY